MALKQITSSIALLVALYRGELWHGLEGVDGEERRLVSPSLSLPHTREPPLLLERSRLYLKKAKSRTREVVIGSRETARFIDPDRARTSFLNRAHNSLEYNMLRTFCGCGVFHCCGRDRRVDRRVSLVVCCVLRGSGLACLVSRLVIASRLI